MTTLIINGTVVTRDQERPFIAEGAVAFEGERIVAVGDSTELLGRFAGVDGGVAAGVDAGVAAGVSAGVRIMDARGRLVMPGFINAHMHYYSTFARGIDFGGRPATTFGEILSGLWWKLDKMLTLEDVYYSAVGPMIDAVRMGVTSVIDHHASPSAVRGSLFEIARAAKLMGLRSNLCYEVSDRDGTAVAREGIAENVDFARSCKEQGGRAGDTAGREGDSQGAPPAGRAGDTAGRGGDLPSNSANRAGDARRDSSNRDMLGGLMGMHAQMTISPETMDAVVEAAQDVGVGYHIHAAEGIEDVVDSLAKHGVRVIERLDDCGILGPGSLVVHCVHVTDDEIALLAQSGVAVVNNPESNMSNAVGCSPVLRMLDAGVLVGMGTDGYCVDMTESLRAVHAIQKHAAGLPCVAWAEPHQMLFENNREIFNRLIEGEVGVLRPGAYADVVIVGYQAPTPVLESTVASHLLFGVSGRNVDTTIINGRVVMEERELIGIDEEQLMARSREQAAKLWARI